MKMKILMIMSMLFYLTKSSPIIEEKKTDNLIYDPDKVVDNIPYNLNDILSNLKNYVEVSLALVKEIKTEWTLFKTKFRKTYTDVKEEAKRFLNFVRNYVQVKSHNIRFMAGETQYNMSINHLSDLSDNEYSTLLGLKFANRKKGRMYMSPMSKVELPTNVDYRKTAVTPVKDQGVCGSCWAFSSTGSLEGQHYRLTKKLVSLSEQQLVDCSLENKGCGGGMMDAAFEYVRKNGGIDTEVSYPYVSGKTGQRQNSCKYDPKNVGAHSKGFIDIKSGNEEKLMEAVALVGPISVGIDASNLSFRNYHTGIYDEPNCSPEDLDHGVLVVGYGIDNHSKTPYWLVKNSWNTTWGDEGYIKMKRNANNMCGIATAASYPIV